MRSVTRNPDSEADEGCLTFAFDVFASTSTVPPPASPSKHSTLPATAPFAVFSSSLPRTLHVASILPLLVLATIPPIPVHVPASTPFCVSRRSGEEVEEEEKVPVILPLTVLRKREEAEMVPVMGLEGGGRAVKRRRVAVGQCVVDECAVGEKKYASARESRNAML